MSVAIYDGPGLFVTRYVGPASEGDDRQRWQFTVPRAREYAVLNRDDLRALVEALRRDLADD